VLLGGYNHGFFSPERVSTAQLQARTCASISRVHNAIR
jgi:hypothetical protein